MSELLPAVVLGPEQADYAVIWLHGLGADGYDFEPIVEELVFQNKAQTRFIFPHAPERAVTINQGYVMRAWYDIYDLSPGAKEDEQGIRESERALVKLIANEIHKGIPAENIVLAGFSQGGAIVLHTGLRYPEPLAGIMALSTYLPLADRFVTEKSTANGEVDIFMAHGDFDPVVPIVMASNARRELFENNYRVSWHTYPMEHSVIPQEIDDISQWLNNALN